MNTATTATTATTAKPITLNDNQIAVLTHAIDHTQGKVEWFPDTIKGGARKKVIEGLFTRAMIIGSNGDWIVTDAAYEALGRPRPDQTAAEAATPAGKKVAQGQGCAEDRSLRRRRAGRAAHAREQQAGAGDRDAQAARGRHHRADLRSDELAGAHGARHLRRGLQEEARPDRHLRQGRRRRARLPHRRGRADGVMSQRNAA